MSVPTLEGVTPKTITTDRLSTRVLFTGDEEGIPVLFLHGNVSSATWWEENMISLPADFRGIAPDQRGFGGADLEKKIDATRGMGDLADDAVALLDNLGIEKSHVVGSSLGGMVIWRLIIDYPHRLLSAILANPGSPYGFGATKDITGAPTEPDFAGSGGGLSNPELIERLKSGDASLDSPFSPRSALRTLLVKPPFIPPREDELVLSMLTSHIGEQDVPGDTDTSPNWPHVAPGVWGATNATSPKYAGDIEKIINSEPKIKILWMRGSHDMTVSDTAAADVGVLGRMGILPGWPGEDAYPPQPMLAQTRAVLEKYAENGGSYREVVIRDTGHIPWIEKPDEFNSIVNQHLTE